MENVEENEKMSKGYAELTELVRPYIDDFTGYNEELGGFDVVLCVKEFRMSIILRNFIQEENKIIKESRDYYKRIVDGCPEVCEDGFCLIDSYNKKLSKTLTAIKEIAYENIRIADLAGLNGVYRRGLAEHILKVIKECGANDEISEAG